jgi:hypothetical protein
MVRHPVLLDNSLPNVAAGTTSRRPAMGIAVGPGSG